MVAIGLTLKKPSILIKHNVIMAVFGIGSFALVVAVGLLCFMGPENTSYVGIAII